MNGHRSTENIIADDDTPTRPPRQKRANRNSVAPSVTDSVIKVIGSPRTRVNGVETQNDEKDQTMHI